MNPTFDYHQVSNPTFEDIVLLGKEGWELCSIGRHKHYFKRTVFDPSLKVADIRNKLSPMTQLISVLESIEENDLPSKESPYIWKAVEDSKKAINYLSQTTQYETE